MSLEVIILIEGQNSYFRQNMCFINRCQHLNMVLVLVRPTFKSVSADLHSRLSSSSSCWAKQLKQNLGLKTKRTREWESFERERRTNRGWEKKLKMLVCRWVNRETERYRKREIEEDQRSINDTNASITYLRICRRWMQPNIFQAFEWTLFLVE